MVKIKQKARKIGQTVIVLMKKKPKAKRRTRIRNPDFKKNFFLIVGSAILIAVLAIAVFAMVTDRTPAPTQVEENTKNIVELKSDVAETKQDLAELSGKFDDFMYRNLEIMLDMKQAIDQATRDESVHVTLTNVGVADTESSSSSETNQDVAVTSSDGKDMPHSS